jgi:hypothetical protein
MIVFKLERERPAFTHLGAGVLFLKDRYVRMYEYGSSKETLLMCIRRPATSGSAVARSVHYNEPEAMLLVSLDAEGGSYELYHVTKDAAGGGEVAGVLGEVVEVEEGEGAFGVVELEAAVAMVFEGPAIADGLSEFARIFGAIEEAGSDLHGAGLGGAAGGREGEAAGSGLFLCPEEEVGGLVGEGEAFGAALEVGFGDGLGKRKPHSFSRHRSVF